jgi:hypothetical protein
MNVFQLHHNDVSSISLCRTPVMKTITKVLFSVVLLLFIFSNSFSQSSYNFHIGPSIPVSDYGVYTIHAREGDIRATGKLGIEVGFQYSYKWPARGFGLFSSIDFILGDISRKWINKAAEISVSYPLLSLPEYLYLPLSAGFFYQYEISESISLLCNSGMTFNYMKVTDNEWVAATWETDWSTSFGFRVGFGCLIKKRITINVDYLGLGNHEIEERLVREDETIVNIHDLNVQLLTITAGWSF